MSREPQGLEQKMFLSQNRGREAPPGRGGSGDRGPSLIVSHRRIPLNHRTRRTLHQLAGLAVQTGALQEQAVYVDSLQVEIN